MTGSISGTGLRGLVNENMTGSISGTGLRGLTHFKYTPPDLFKVTLQYSYVFKFF